MPTRTTPFSARPDTLTAALHAYVRTVVPTTDFGSPCTQLQTPRVDRSSAAAAREKAVSEEPVTVLSSRDQDVIPSYLH